MPATSPPAATPVPLSSADLMWARLPGPAPLPTGVLSFRGHVPLKTAEAFVRDRLCAVPAFARRFAEMPGGRLAWAQVSGIDVARHLHYHKLACDSRSPEFFEAMSRWVQAPLRAGQPPWDMTLVDCADRSLIFARVHHAVTDGPGMMQALLSCHDDKDAWPRAARLAARMASAVPRPGIPERMPPPYAASRLGGACHRLAQGCLWGASGVLRGCAMAYALAHAAWAIATRSADTPTVLKPGSYVTDMAYAQVAERWPVETLKRIARNAGGGTVNDVVLAVLTGALRDVLQAHGERLEDVTLRAMQTVNMPRKADATGVSGNNVGLAMSLLPIDVADPVTRYRQMRLIMARFKASMEPWVAAKSMAAIARLPQGVIDFMHRRTTRQCSTLVSNVVGPPEPFVIEEHVAENMFWFTPRFGDVGVTFPVISYAGGVQVTVQVDRALGLDPRALAHAVQTQYEALRGALSR